MACSLTLSFKHSGTYFQLNFIQNLIIFIQENAIENVICIMSEIWFNPQECVNSLRPREVQIMACRLVGAKPLSKPMLEYC